MIVYNFRFQGKIPFEEIDDTLMLATLAAECLHGRTQVHLDARFQAHRKDNSCWIEADTEVGRNIAFIFTGLMVRLFGEDAFKVKRLTRDPGEKSVEKEGQAGDSDPYWRKEAKQCS